MTLKALSLAETHGAFATTDGEMYTWGSNFSGQVGRGAVEAQAPEHASPGRVQALEGWSIADVACGSEHTIAAAGPSLFCFGSNEVGQCGIGDDGPLTLPKPKLLKALRGIRVAQVAAGDSHSLALTTCGTVLSWGGNTHGQLGHGDTLNRFVPVPVSALWALPVVQIAAGEAHSLALTAGGCVFSFGRNRSGQLGLSLGSSPAMPGGERRPVHLSRKPPVNLKFLRCGVAS